MSKVLKDLIDLRQLPCIGLNHTENLKRLRMKGKAAQFFLQYIVNQSKMGAVVSKLYQEVSY